MTDTLAGTIERVVFHNEDNGFCVLRVRIEGGRSPTTLVGRLACVSAGERFEASGEWVNDRAHGRQFQASALRVSPPGTTEGIEKYLGSGMIQGVGPHFASRLVEAFGDKVFEVFDEAPERLLEVRGIGRGRQKRILAAWADQKAVRDIMVFLHSHGVGTARAVRIYRTYGADAIRLLEENPYRLSSDIHGIGFKTADDIARHLGIDSNSRIRAEAGLTYVLEERALSGQCAYPRADLLAEALELLSIDAAVLEAALASRLAAGFFVEHPIAGAACIYLARLFEAEVRLAEGLLRLRNTPHPLARTDADRAIPWAEARVGIRLSESQTSALRTAIASKVVAVTGGPGVGKTTLVRSVLEILRAKRLECRLCAPTGRAARRLAETTGAEAKTIHRLLEFQPQSGRFRHDRGHPLKADVVILDEASMVDVVLMDQLVDAIPSGAILVVVGDVDQLPSVGPGQVLQDLLDSGALPTVRLTEIFRQAAESQIITNAHRINEGLEPLPAPDAGALGDFFFVEADEEEDVLAKLRMLVAERIPRRFGLDPLRDVQILVPMNRGPLGARALNAFLQELLNPPGKPGVARFGFTYRLDDKVMQIQNNYDKEVFNGDIGFIREVDPDADELRIEYDGRLVPYEVGELDEILPAYACTVHKSQGSEYPAVVLPLHTQHYIMLERNILYTAVTRAKRLVVIVGSKRALSLALRRGEGSRRISGLEERLAAGGRAGGSGGAIVETERPWRG